MTGRRGNRRTVGSRLATVMLAVATVAGVGIVATPQPVSAAKPLRYYIELGDSWAVGTDAFGSTSGAPTSESAPVLAAKKMHMTLENFGCSGATSSSALNDVCASQWRAVGAPAYGAQTQEAAAVQFINAHRGQIGAIVVSLGGNDIGPCTSSPDPINCILTAVATMQTNLTTLAHALRTAAGTGVPLIGLTYFDPTLSLWVWPPVNQLIAHLSVSVFENNLNPAMKTAYTSAGGVFVDVTSATGIYTSFTKLKNVAPYGKVPYPVAQVCKLTWGCITGDAHPNLKGLKTLAKLTVNEWKTLPHP